MLILTRKTGESVNIGAHVTVTILSVNGSQVRIGIAAPKDVAVHREEIFKRIARTGGEQSSEDAANGTGRSDRGTR